MSTMSRSQIVEAIHRMEGELGVPASTVVKSDKRNSLLAQARELIQQYPEEEAPYRVVGTRSDDLQEVNPPQPDQPTAPEPEPQPQPDQPTAPEPEPQPQPEPPKPPVPKPQPQPEPPKPPVPKPPEKPKEKLPKGNGTRSIFHLSGGYMVALVGLFLVALAILAHGWLTGRNAPESAAEVEAAEVKAPEAPEPPKAPSTPASAEEPKAAQKSAQAPETPFNAESGENRMSVDSLRFQGTGGYELRLIPKGDCSQDIDELKRAVNANRAFNAWNYWELKGEKQDRPVQ